MKIIRKVMLLLAVLFIFSLCSCSFKSKETETKKVDVYVTKEIETNKNDAVISDKTELNVVNATSFIGEWHRTNISQAFTGDIKITNQKSDSFDFDFRGWFAARSNGVSGTARITDSNKAIFTYNNNYSNQTANVTFIIENGLLTVSADNNSYLLLYNGVRIDGSYTIAEPVYTNVNLVDSIFPTDTDKQKAKNLLGQVAYEQMLAVLQVGLQDKNDKLNYSGNIQGTGETVDIKIIDNFYYILGYGLDRAGYTLYTNDPAFQSTLPDFLTTTGFPNSNLNFVFKSIP